MKTRAALAAVVATFAMSGLAHADEGRGRMRLPSQINWEQRRAPTPIANASSTIQQGGGNAASVVQTGAGNSAGVRQFGRDNTGAITQVGNNNAACLIQAGRNLNGSIQQVGDNQSSGVLQTRWGQSEIPVEVCASVTNRGDLGEWLPERPDRPERVRARGRVRGEP